MHRAQQMAPHTKRIVERAVNREETLGLPQRFEPAHPAFLLARRLIRHFGPVVRPVGLAVRDTRQELPPYCPIADELVCH